MSVARIIRQNLHMTLYSVGIWSLIALAVALIYGCVAWAVGLGLLDGRIPWMETSVRFALFHAVNLLPGFLGGGALVGLVSAQVQFWAWFTVERER